MKEQKKMCLVCNKKIGLEMYCGCCSDECMRADEEMKAEYEEGGGHE